MKTTLREALLWLQSENFAEVYDHFLDNNLSPALAKMFPHLTKGGFRPILQVLVACDQDPNYANMPITIHFRRSGPDKMVIGVRLFDNTEKSLMDVLWF